MSFAYVNGRYVSKEHALVSVEDRGYQFSDGVYEVISVYQGILIDHKGHFNRLFRSLAELKIQIPWTERVLKIIVDQIIKRNKVKTGSIYLQITRGRAERKHSFPDKNTRPCIVVTSDAKNGFNKIFPNGTEVITVQDNRWGRPDIKSVSLLANVLAKETAVQAGCSEALLTNSDDEIIEGSSSNFWMVDSCGRIITRPIGEDLLAGITRARLLKLARLGNIEVKECIFLRKEAIAAEEVFLSSTTAPILPVISIDGNQVGNGKPGPITKILWTLYCKYLDDEAGSDRKCE